MKFKITVTYYGKEGYKKIRTVFVNADYISKAHEKACTMINDIQEIVLTSSKIIKE